MTRGCIHPASDAYALIGHPLGHSLSPQLHAGIGAAAGFPVTYELCDLKPDELVTNAPDLFKRFRGINVTVPYQAAIIPFVERIDDSAREVGVVNTIYKNCGYNTDIDGLIRSGLNVQGRTVLLIGYGGAAAAAAALAERQGARLVVVTGRNAERGRAWAADRTKRSGSLRFDFCEAEDILSFQTRYDIVIQTTPAGMWPHVGSLPLPREILVRLFERDQPLAFDAIYNPTATRFLLLAQAAGCRTISGLDMLFGQGVAAQAVFHPDIDFSQFESDLRNVRDHLADAVWEQSAPKIVLTGFMGTGKTHIGALLAYSLFGEKMPDLSYTDADDGCRSKHDASSANPMFFDLDDLIVERWGLSIPEIFAQHGEEAFRRSERDVLLECLKIRGFVLATGGASSSNRVWLMLFIVLML